MWYFVWILGTFLSCACGIIAALSIEYVEIVKSKNRIKQNNDYFL